MNAAIDWDELRAKLGSEPGFINDLLGVVISSNARVPAALREAARINDFSAVERLAHRTKGMAGDIVAMNCHELARSTEIAARSHHGRTAELAMQLATSVELLLDEARAHLAG